MALPTSFQDGSNAKTLMWQKTGSQGDEWKQGLVNLSPGQSSYQVTKYHTKFVVVAKDVKGGGNGCCKQLSSPSPVD